MKPANPEAPVKSKSTKKTWLYYYVIGFNLLIILLTLIPLHSYSRSYTQAVHNNHVWAERVNQVTQLGELVATMHETSISVLNSDHISLNKDQLESSNQEFQEVLKSVHNDIINFDDQYEVAKIILTFGGIEEHGSAVYRESMSLINQVESEIPLADSSQLLRLDLNLSKSLSLIKALGQEFKNRQSQQIDSQTAQAEVFEWILLGLTAALSVIISGSLWYSHLHVATKDSEKEINIERLEILLTTKNTVNMHIGKINDLSNEVLSNLAEPNHIQTIKQIHQQANSLSDIVHYMIKRVRPDQADLLEQKSIADNDNATLSTGNDTPREVSNTQLNCRILTADDGPNNLKFNCFVLKKAGADVVGADNGQIALDLALKAQEEGQPFDIFLMDMQMPVLDGFEATRKLRAAGFTEPIIALTGSDEVGDKEKCLAAGCDDFITKPVSREKLVQVVAQYAAQHVTV